VGIIGAATMEQPQLDPNKAAKGAAANAKTSEISDQKQVSSQDAKAADKSEDAVTMLKNDHRAAANLFESYFQSKRRAEKLKLAKQVCQELMIHTVLEEEIFYPACREHVEDDMMDEAQVEHDAAKVLITEIILGSPEQPFFDAKVKVLSELIKHHVNEEEKRADGMFVQAKAAGLNVEELAARMVARKQELLAEAEQETAPTPPETRSFATMQTKENAMSQGQNRNRDRYSDDDDYDRRGSSSRSSGGYSDRDTDRNYGSGASRGRDRDDDGRSSHSSNGGRSRYQDDHDDRRSESSRSQAQNRERDELGRFVSDDHDDRRGRGRDDDYRGSSGRGNQGNQNQERDERGRFMSDDDRGRSSGGRSSRDDDDRYSQRSSSGGRGSQGGRDDDRGGSRSSSRYEDDDRRRSSSRDDDDRNGYSRDRGQGGWFGDPEGHAEAARRGWRNRD
jgi:hemerythrin superfamily protein